MGAAIHCALCHFNRPSNTFPAKRPWARFATRNGENAYETLPDAVGIDHGVGWSFGCANASANEQAHAATGDRKSATREHEHTTHDNSGNRRSRREIFWRGAGAVKGATVLYRRGTGTLGLHAPGKRCDLRAT